MSAAYCEGCNFTFIPYSDCENCSLDLCPYCNLCHLQCGVIECKCTPIEKCDLHQFDEEVMV